ncbi:hypothetical protein DPMN_062710 [Dreissena polymorpha]|uniref:Uncharacterized protein n=1 Tax=Dreissena polymorpha TaxID=45954 RepID=A0A9D4HKE6_DREPO|nr:hypothetical protein DPMN_062710 [Dreissena polymorpha]
MLQDGDYEVKVEPVLSTEADGAACPQPDQFCQRSGCYGNSNRDLSGTSAMGRVTPKLLKLLPSYCFLPIRVISTLMLFVLFTMIIDIYVLTSIRMILLSQGLRW